MHNRIERDGLSDRIEVSSCGVGDYHVGEPPDARAIREAQQRGVDISHQHARAIRGDDFDRYDYILCMDRDNLDALKALAPRDYSGHLGLLLDFSTRHEGEGEIGDPYFGGSDNFERVGDRIEAACEGLLAHLRREGLLH